MNIGLLNEMLLAAAAKDEFASLIYSSTSLVSETTLCPVQRT
jgi:hypothetical protein